MPVPMLKALAKRYGVSEATAEAAWNSCKSAIHPTEEGGKGPGYGVVVDCVKDKLRKMKGGQA